MDKWTGHFGFLVFINDLGFNQAFEKGVRVRSLIFFPSKCNGRDSSTMKPQSFLVQHTWVKKVLLY